MSVDGKYDHVDDDEDGGLRLVFEDSVTREISLRGLEVVTRPSSNEELGEEGFELLSSDEERTSMVGPAEQKKKT